MQEKRAAGDQRRLLVETIRSTGRWRRRKADEFGDDGEARRENARAAAALRTLANFVEGLPDDDADLSLHALCRTGERDGGLDLTHETVVLLSRFGLNRGAWQSTSPGEDQMRNVLRRMDGIEARERAEEGYGDD